MSKVQTGKLPVMALSFRYKKKGAFSDCFFIDVSRKVSLEEYIVAFYTTPLFKIERSILSVFALKASTDQNAKQLSLGHTRKYSAWTVEERSPNQILLCDFSNRTRSWLMVQNLEDSHPTTTRLYFGSIVMPKARSKTATPSFGILFHMFGKFHNLYSRALLKAAYKKLHKTSDTECQRIRLSRQS
ncbi:MAG: hypothetical protein OEY38_07820 [Gammaproteobacteria bacterium]|nr:hypothetical protein [Gammaproteobacteria bacterium]